ncbi:MAG TPA: MFS transporter [Iamia sp.]
MTAGPDPALGLGAGRRGAALAALLGATFIGTVNNSLANVAVPSMAEDLGVGLSTAVWIVSAFALALGVMMPLAGRLGDLHGARRVFLIGVVLFAASSVLVATGGHVAVVVLGRVGQGIAGSPVLPCIMYTATRLYPPDRRGRVLGLWAAVNASALAAGPALGGLAVDHLGWRWLFGLSAPLILLVGVAVWVLVPADPPTKGGRVDLPGAALLAVALGAIVLPVTESSRWGFAHPLTITLLLVAAASSALLVLRVRTAPDPFISPALLRAPGFLATSGVAGLQMLGLFAVTFVVPVSYVVRGDDAAAAGLVTSVLPVSMLLGALVAGRMADRFGFPVLARAGGLSIVAGAVVIGLSANVRPGVIAGLAVVGSGISLIQAPAAAAVTLTAPPGQAGLAAGVFNAARFLVGGIGATAAALAFERASGAGEDQTGVADAAAVAGLRAGLGVAVVAGLAIVAVSATLRRTNRSDVVAPAPLATVD